MHATHWGVRIATVALLVVATVATAPAAQVTVLYTEPAAGTMPQFGTVPFPINLYYDGGAPGAGDGTLINKDPGNTDGGYEKFGIETLVLPMQDRSILAGFDRLDGFGVTAAVWFFFDGEIDEETLPGAPVVSNGLVQTSPSASDSIFMVEVGSSPAVFIPVKFTFDFDTRVPNTLGIVPLEGTVLKANTDYAVVVTDAVKGSGSPVKSTADFDSARNGPILGGGYTYVTGTLGVPGDSIAGMTVFTTQTTTATLAAIRTGVVDACTPTVDFSGGLIFSGAAQVDTFFGAGNAPNVGLVASGYYESPRLQTLDPTNSSHRDGSGGNAESDLPIGTIAEIDDEQFQDLGSNGGGCDLTVPGTPDGLPDVVDIDPATPGTLDMANVPVSLAVPVGTPPANGWPVIIVQHGLGGHRSTTLAFADLAAQAGLAVIGIDSVDHGLRWDETDDEFNFTGLAGQDGLPDGDLGSAVNFGFFEAFASIAAIRDNFRQTYVDLMSLVRAIDTDAFDAPVGVDLDPDNIYYIGLSLGGLMGTGMTPYVPEVKAIVLDATGGNLSTELFINSTIGAGALGLIQALFDLDPFNISADFAFFSSFSQMILDAGDGTTNAVHFFKEPFPSPFRKMSVIQLEDMNDTVVPNQANEAIAVAAGFEMFDPHVQNLVETVQPLPVAPTEGFVEANVDSATTAALFQLGPATHAAITEDTATLSLVPGYALIDEFRDGDLQTVYVPLIRNLRIKHESLLDDIFDWFNDIVTNGPPGRFTYTKAPLNHNSFENQQLGLPLATHTFFDRTLNAGGATPYQEPTPDVSISVARNSVAGRMTMTRSTLGPTVDGADGDMPPLATLATPSVLPFFVGVQRPGAPTYEGLDLTMDYTEDELTASGCAEGDLFAARFNQVTNSYDTLPSAVDATNNRVSVTGSQGADGVYGVFCDGSGLAFNGRLSGGKVKLKFRPPPKDQTVRVKASIIDPTNSLVIDPTTADIDVTVWEDRDTVLFSEALNKDCWVNNNPKKSTWKSSTCSAGSPGSFTKARIRKSTGGGVTEFKLTIKAAGPFAIEDITQGGGGTQAALTFDGTTWATTGGRCRMGGIRINCTKYDE